MPEPCSTPGCDREPAVVFQGRRYCWPCEDRRRLREGRTHSLPPVVFDPFPWRWLWAMLVAGVAVVGLLAWAVMR